MISIKRNNLYLKFNSFTFPGGEVGIKLNAGDYKFIYEKAEYQTIIAHIKNSEDILQLAMAKDALQRLDEKTPIQLFMPYLPYARQDRVCDKGESFSLKVFCDFINHLNFKRVIICDPHSEVAPALLNNVKVITQFDIINKYLDFTNIARKCILVSPDLGAIKKTSEIAKYFEHDDFVSCEKIRKLSTGEIIRTVVHCDDFKGRDIVVIDDILDGCKSFIEIAKVCKTKNCGKFILYGTHAIFSKGVDICFNNGIDELWVTNSFHSRYDNRVKVLNLEERFEI